MRKRIVLGLAIGTVLLFCSAINVLHSSGDIFDTGSPFDGTTCAQCHSGGATTPSVTISGSPAFGIGDTYVPGQTYTISIICSGSYPKYGFNAEVLNASNSADGGICGPPISNCQKTSSPSNYTHTAPTGTANAATFSFRWTAPASGTVFIYAAVLGVNLNGTKTGDKVNPVSLALTASPAAITNFGTLQLNIEVFPNPAKDNIRVKYSLTENSQVAIKLYSLNGDELSTLYTGELYGGEYDLELRLPPVSAHGPYLIKLLVNGRQQIRKIVIM